MNLLFFMNLLKVAFYAMALTLASLPSLSHAECHRGQRERAPRRFKEDVTITLGMGIPLILGTVPVGANLDVTPFAIAPNGKLFKGETVNIFPSSGFSLTLPSILIPKPLQGNYTIGYYMTLGAGSPTFPLNAVGNFSGVVVQNPVGSIRESIIFAPQTLFFYLVNSPNDVVMVTGSFPIVKL